MAERFPKASCRTPLVTASTDSREGTKRLHNYPNEVEWEFPLRATPGRAACTAIRGGWEPRAGVNVTAALPVVSGCRADLPLVKVSLRPALQTIGLEIPPEGPPVLHTR